MLDPALGSKTFSNETMQGHPVLKDSKIIKQHTRTSKYYSSICDMFFHAAKHLQ